MRASARSSVVCLLLVLATGCSAAAGDGSAPNAEHAESNAAALHAELGALPGSGRSVAASLAAGTTLPVVTTLAQRRAEIKFPTYTPDQRQLVADQAKLLFEQTYVHRSEKVAFYGADADPVPRIDAVAANARTMDDATFQLTVEDIFSTTRDLHTNYYMPFPYACHESWLSFDLEEIRGKGDPRFAVIRTYPGDLPLAPGVSNIAVGDVLVSYDGKSAKDAAADRLVAGAGANVAGGRRRAMQAMTFLWHTLQPLPGNDVAHLVFRRADGTKYNVDLPWISYRYCEQIGQGAAVASSPSTAASVSGPRFRNSSLAVNEYQRAFQERTKRAAAPAPSVTLQPTAEPILSYGKVTQKGRDYGYLRLTSFVPEQLDDDSTIALVAQLLKTELANTAGLIFDVRDNGGGSIYLSEGLLQLFAARRVESEKFRLLNSATNAFVLDTAWDWWTGDIAWKNLVDASKGTGTEFTGALEITPSWYTNRISTSYFGPVALLTNSGCYSACDMFSAGLQDQGLATIWGEDESTGAGGANVITWSDFVWVQDQVGQGGPFKNLPGGQDMRVAWRQALRVGIHQGELIEDYGISPDESASLTVNDLVSGRADQLKKITNGLHGQIEAHPSRVTFADNEAEIGLPVGSPIAVTAHVTSTTDVEFFLDGAKIGAQRIGYLPPSDVVLSPHGYAVSAPGLHVLEIRASQDCHAAWRSFRSIYVY